MFTKFFSKISAVLIAASLTACGGGSGGSTTSSPTTPVTNTCSNGATNYPTCNTVALQTSVATPTYAATSDELITFNELNGFRKALGLGLLAQSLTLDNAAKNHSNYIAINQIFGHVEDGAKPGFTGIYPQDRVAFAGYKLGTYGGEVVGVGAAPSGIRGLINSIYHRDLLAFQMFTDVGISFNSGIYTPVVIDFGATLSQANASNFTTNYPFDGQTNLPLAMVGEIPNPFPELTYNDYSSKTSSPITFYSANGTTLSVTTFTVTQAGQTTPLSVRLLTAATDVNKEVQPNVAHIIGNAPFLANTKYVVNFVGTVNGASISKTWSFTTGTSVFYGGGALPQ